MPGCCAGGRQGFQCDGYEEHWAEVATEHHFKRTLVDVEGANQPLSGRVVEVATGREARKACEMAHRRPAAGTSSESPINGKIQADLLSLDKIVASRAPEGIQSIPLKMCGAFAGSRIAASGRRPAI